MRNKMKTQWWREELVTLGVMKTKSQAKGLEMNWVESSKPFVIHKQEIAK